MNLFRCTPRVFCLSLLAVLTFFGFSRTSQAADAPDPSQADAIWKLYEGEVPGAKGKGPGHEPDLYLYQPKENPSQACVLIFPGGGYYVHAIDHEGVQVARRLNADGITAAVVRYRLKPDGYNEHDAFLDAKRSIRLVRSKAEKLGFSPNRIGVLGFSAGGHLASVVALNFDAGDPQAVDPVERFSSRPDFAVPGYTVPGPQEKGKGREDGWKEVTSQVPPHFLWVTHQDSNRPAETAKYYAMLHEAGVDAELHIFGGWGPHGLGLAPGAPGIRQWDDLLVSWLRRKNLLTTEPRVEVSGRITIDGKPINRGWVELTPLDNPHAPTASAYITHRVDGKFTIDGDRGPIAGRHRITVYKVAEEFLTTPSMNDAETLQKDASGKSLEVEVRPGLEPLKLDLRSS